MKSIKNIEQMIKEFNVTTNADMDKKVREDVLEVIRKPGQTKSTETKPNIWRIIMKKPIIKLTFAAVVVIITTLCCFIFYASINEQNANIGFREVRSKPLAKMMSVLTINTIYQHGGFDAVQQHLEMISEIKGSYQRHTITLRDMLAELNDNGYDRRQL